jgi:large subunit ribosomal protein L15
MQLHEIKRKTPSRKKKYVGRGGKRGTTAGRGTKGQKSRAGHRMRPELRDVIKKLPKLRGRGKNTNVSIQNKPVVVSLDALETHFEAGEVVNPSSLAAKGIAAKKKGKLPVVKILTGKKELTKKITVEKCAISATARAQVEKVGGHVN